MSHALNTTLRGRVTRWFSGQMQYTLSRADNDTNGIGSFPANDYDLAGEWARADFDRRHRFVVIGRVNAGSLADVGVSLTTTSAGPYTETLGQDLYRNGRGRARPPGVPRNSLDAAAATTLDIRASRAFKLQRAVKDGRTITIGADAFNVLNRVNYSNFVGTLSSPLFGTPVGARSPPQLQFSTRFKF